MGGFLTPSRQRLRRMQPYSKQSIAWLYEGYLTLSLYLREKYLENGYSPTTCGHIDFLRLQAPLITYI
jgi:hypothetical protein